MFKFFKELFSKKETIDTAGVERIEVKRAEVKRIPVTGETPRCRLWRVQYTDTGEIFDLDPGDADGARELLASGRPIKILGFKH